MVEVWFIYAFLTAILISIALIIEKKTLLKEHAMEFCAVLSLFTLLVSLPLFLFIDYSKLQLMQLALLFFLSVIGSIGFLLVTKSVRHMEISSSSPLLALSPGVIALFAFIFLGESLTLKQIGGIGFLIFGSYILETKSAHNLLEPLKIFAKSRYIHYILLALLLFGITAVFERFILFHLDMEPVAFIAFVHVFLAVNFFAMLHLFHDGFRGVKRGVKRVGWWVFLVAVFLVGSRLAQASAIKLAYVGLVVSIKRFSVFFTVLIGGKLFREKNVFRKSIASLIMILGIVLIAI